MLAVCVSVQRIEVIPVVHGINPDFLSGHDLTPDGVVVGMLRVELDDDAGFHVGEPFLRFREASTGAALRYVLLVFGPPERSEGEEA